MALIKCEECGQMVSDKASSCPHCGAPVEKRIVCEECGAKMLASANSCPQCGCPNPNYCNKDKSSQDVEVQVENVAPTSTNSDKKASVALPMIIGIVVYIVLTTILSNLFNDGITFQDRIENDILFCAVVATLISWFVAKSMIDRIICSIVIVLVAVIAAADWMELMVGSAVIVHLTNICAIIVVAIRRKYHIAK